MALTALSGYSQSTDSSLAPVASYQVHGRKAHCFVEWQVSRLAYHVERSAYMDSVIDAYKRLGVTYKNQINILERQKATCQQQIKLLDSLNQHHENFVHRQDTVINRQKSDIRRLKGNNRLFTWIGGIGWAGVVLILLL